MRLFSISMKKQIVGILLILATLSSAAKAAGPITFTVTATADATGYGYDEGSNYTFIFTTGESFTAGNNAFSSDVMSIWSQETTNHDQLWSSIGGTGLAGEFINPTTELGTPDSFIELFSFDSHELYLRVSQDGFVPMGITTADSLMQLGSVNVYATVPRTFSHAGGYIEPNLYFSNYIDDYFNAGGNLSLESLDGVTEVTFSITNLTISSVPEPSSYVMIVGVVALGYGAFRRPRPAGRIWTV